MLLLIALLVFVNGLCPEDVAHFADKVIKSQLFSRSTWRVNITYVENNKLVPIYSHLPHVFSVPASNNKVLSTAAAFTHFGPNFQFQTNVYLTGFTKKNTICLKSSGDPTITHGELATLAQQIAPQLSPSGMVLEVADSLFGEQDIPDGWEWGDMYFDYGAPPVPSVVDHNYIILNIKPGHEGARAMVVFEHQEDNNTVHIENRILTLGAGAGTNVWYEYRLRDPHTLVLRGQIAVNGAPIQINPAIHNAAMRLGKAFSNHLANNGVQVAAVTSSVYSVCSNGKLLGGITSPPLSTIMNHTLQTSDNLEAEIWMRLLGNVNRDPDLSNYDNGIANVKKVLGSLGIDTKRWIQTDGSGLGRSNLVQPSAEVDVFFHMRDQAEYISLLPVGGVSGTLSDRYIGTPAQGRVHAKTGSLTGVIALSGYVYPKNFQNPIIFSFLINDSSDLSSKTVRDGIDSIVVQLASLDCN